MSARRDLERMSRAAVTFGCFLLIATQPVRAEVIHVPDDYPTIQQAINEAAEAGDEIIVAPETYNEAIDFLGKAIWLHSADGPEVTIIDGEGLDTSVVTCASGEGPGTTLEGFTITNGNAQCGGGMHNFDSSPTVTNCIFDSNMAGSIELWFGGGGMYNDYSSPTLTNCTFTTNHAVNNGGGMCNYESAPTVTNCTFIGNVADDGGGMYMISEFGHHATITDCTFIANSADADGGGVNSFFWSGTITSCTFIANSAQDVGGGMFSYAGTSTVMNCTFDGNTADRGGGMGNMYNHSDITGCLFTANSAAAFGGGMYNETADLARRHGAFGAGSADDGRVFHNEQQLNPTVTNCVFDGNNALYGGGMCNYQCYGHGPTVVNCLFNGNFGLGALCNYYCWDALPIINCTFTGNNTWAIANIDNSSPVIANCIMWGDAGGEILNDPGEPIVTYCDVQGGYEGVGNIDADPLFVDPDNGDYRIGQGSLCIDAADNTAVPEDITTDLGGRPRFVDDPYTQDTGVGYPCVDMGAYEYQGPGCPADFDGDGDVDTADLLFLLAAWGTPDGDVDGDGDTDTADLLALLAAWGECPDSTGGTQR